MVERKRILDFAIDKNLFEKLRGRAFKLKVSMAEIVRQALEAFLKRKGGEQHGT